MKAKTVPKLHYDDRINYESIKNNRARQLLSSSLVKVYKDKTFENYNLDQLLNVICLYKDECDNDEILFWLKNDWSITLKVEQLRLILKKLSGKRLFPKTNKFFVINNYDLIENISDKKDIFEYQSVLITTNTEYFESFLFYQNSFRDDMGIINRTKLGTAIDFIKFKKHNREHCNIEEVLILKRLVNAYAISDFTLIDLYCEFHNKELSKLYINRLLISIQNKFIKYFLEINKRTAR